MIKEKIFAVFAAVLVMAFVAHADSITIVNYGFEEPPLADEGQTTNMDEIPGWEGSGGIENKWYGETEGQQCAFLFQTADMYQLTDHVIGAGETFTLKFDACQSWLGDDIKARIYYDDAGTKVTAAEDTWTFTVAEDWQTYTLGFIVADLPAAVGHNIGVEFLGPSNSGGFDGLDWVRLDYVAGNRAGNPTPADGEQRVNPAAILEWDEPAQVPGATYDVYFGTVSPPPQQTSGQTATSYDPGGLSTMTTYYWRVDAIEDPNTYTGTEWTFKTGGVPVDPVPADGYTHAATPDMDVSWTGDDWAESYKVYSGTSIPLDYRGEVTETSYEGVPTVAQNTDYWWKVEEYVGTDLIGTGGPWKMTTGGPYANWALDETNVGDPNFVIADSVNGYNGLALDANTVADGVFGRALELDGQTTSHAEIPPMNINSDRVTIMAWVKPDGPQANWAGIVFSREPNTTAGISIGDTGSLRYHWSGSSGDWQFNPGLTVPVDCWSHLALTTEPTKATLYRNAYAAENPTTIPSQEFDGTTMLGWDTEQTTRVYKGLLDDVWIYDRPLTAGEIATYYETSDLAKYPDPNNGETGVVLDKVLSWTAGANATGHNVYFNSVSPPTTQVGSNVTVTTYDPALEVDTWYYWRVDEVTAGGTVTGCEWSFKSAPPRAYNPSPADDATGVDPAVVLSWHAGQGGTYTHDVYFGTSETSLAQVATQQTATTWDPYGATDLDWEATYYWRIDERNESDGSLAAVGDVWSFTTIVPSCPSYAAADLNEDCIVDLRDFAELARNWAACAWDPPEACWEYQP